MRNLRGVYRGTRYVLQAHQILTDLHEALPSKALSPLINERYDERTTAHSLGHHLNQIGLHYGVQSRLMTRGERDKWYGESRRYRGKVRIFYAETA